MAADTPPSRNCYVDWLRALSISAVVLGHWLLAAPWIAEDGLRLDHMLAVQPWTQWLTLLFQVMPVFFLVGGYSNAASWDSAQRSGTPYGTWVAGRARRLIGPVVPLILAWAAIAFVFRRFGVWIAMHQLGYLWRDGRLAGPRHALPWLAGGALAWIALTRFGPYPISLVGVPARRSPTRCHPTCCCSRSARHRPAWCWRWRDRCDACSTASAPGRPRCSSTARS